jgi:predicted TIM-barrel fold metal-dependent hydrolase
MLGRRAFMAGFAATAAAGAAGLLPPAAAQARPHRIDVHHHLSAPAWVDALKKVRRDSPPVNNWTLQRSLEDMDKGGVATAMLSTTQPAVSFLDAQDAAAVARATNEYARKLADDHRGRFGIFATLPMPHVDETLKEIEYAFDVLKVDGAGFMTSYGNKFLGDPAFAPVMDELNRRKATAYTHPDNPECCRNLGPIPPVAIEYGTDTTRTVASILVSGTSKRCKDINFIFSHAGGTVTALTERFAVQLIRNPNYKSWTTETVMQELRSYFYDTAQASNPIAMAALTKMVDTSQIVFGTDYPYRTSQEHVKGLSEIFDAGDLKKIERENALRLLPKLRG